MLKGQAVIFSLFNCDGKQQLLRVEIQLLAKQNHSYDPTSPNKIRVLLNFVKRAYN